MNRKLTFLSLVCLFILTSCGEQPATVAATEQAADSTLKNVQLIEEIDQLLQTTERMRSQLDLAIQDTQNN